MIEEYDETNALFPLLTACYKTLNPKESPAVSTSQGPRQESHRRQANVGRDLSGFRIVRSKVARTEETYETTILEIMKAEYVRFSEELIATPEDDGFNVLAYWADCKCGGQFPTIRYLARIIFSIPGSEIENERVFSIAGCVASIKRATMLAENLDMAVHINQNHPDDPMLDMHVSEEKLKAMQGENDPRDTFSTYTGVRDHDTRIADDFETLLIEHELVDEEMAEAFGEE
ncbi:hypothetical protein CYMTET_16836 [Cymbomonas tetramitiformis]|uniref:HAT C-terminal dimerisation domain-containing protein n=1 Tax=Cymbomonas tetramitiformis TaxID=36881 RepID=A0AAE0GCL8_9CHLO|nr:hypothetical protein CYMTET_16836 [Cymbomonas tetramitiformis]